jgi:2-polyprenyl-3-methyl-5-hydroxy-6-metoxy-1,4-benzoquinol methylase
VGSQSPEKSQIRQEERDIASATGRDCFLIVRFVASYIFGKKYKSSVKSIASNGVRLVIALQEQVNQDKLNAFLMKFVGDFGATLHASTVLIGEKLGLYKTLASSGGMTPADLSGKTHTAERYVREWLSAQAAAGYVMYDPKTGKYSMTPEQAFTLADESSPAYLPGAFYVAAAMFKDEPEITESFRTGKGVGWEKHSTDLFVGTEKFFRPAYAGNLVSSWLPALEGVVPKLKAGATVGDVGCGYGSSTVIMAKAFPKSKFIGYDLHKPSIEFARKSAQASGLSDRVTFEVARAQDYPSRNLDLVTFFDCLHDMGDPAGAAKHVKQSLKPDGTWMIVEPYANEKLEDNYNPVGRVYFAASTMICTPASKAQEVGLALGAQASDSRLRDVVMSGGFKSFRRATETPFNRVFEAKP